MLDFIQQEIEKTHNINLNGLQSRRRDRKTVAARRAFAKQAFQGNASMKEIAEYLKKDRSTVHTLIHGKTSCKIKNTD